jgi:hypothetical protein
VRALLAQRDARLFLGGQIVSMFGDWALVLVLGIWAKALTGSSAQAGLIESGTASSSLSCSSLRQGAACGWPAGGR